MPLARGRYACLTLRVRRPRAPEQIEHTRPKRVGIGPVHAKRVDLVQKVSFEGGVTVTVVARRQVGFDRRHVRLPERSIEVIPESADDSVAIGAEPTVAGHHVSVRRTSRQRVPRVPDGE